MRPDLPTSAMRRRCGCSLTRKHRPPGTGVGCLRGGPPFGDAANVERASLCPRNEAVVEAAYTFRRAARLVIDGDTAAAQAVVASLDDEVLRSHWFTVGAAPAALGVLPRTLPPAGAPLVPKTPGAGVIAAVFARDGWRCRWCTTPVIARHALRRMHLVFPVLFPRGDRDADRHALLLAAGATPDHVLPRSCGGTHQPDNLVTACWPCQFARGEYTMEQLGLMDPRLRPPVIDDWDGVAWFRD
ncbi:unannotated protein [freshwater metagenome]|uniref:Unannotated protein n=1 Tax=freshwater metagenome TaxID=449393 RepID=A0A6J6GFY8_9ZZZZ